MNIFKCFGPCSTQSRFGTFSFRKSLFRLIRAWKNPSHDSYHTWFIFAAGHPLTPEWQMSFQTPFCCTTCKKASCTQIKRDLKTTKPLRCGIFDEDYDGKNLQSFVFVSTKQNGVWNAICSSRVTLFIRSFGS